MELAPDNTVTQKHWQELAAEKKERQAATIPKEWILTNLPPKEQLSVIDFPEKSGLLDDKEIEITNTEIGGLLEKLAKGIWSAVEVTTAFSKRAIIAHQLVNCLTEIFIDRALKRAAELDEHLKTTGKVVGPLHGMLYVSSEDPFLSSSKGLPISLKDQISIQGLESTMGYVSWIGQYAAKNSVLADVLEACGAVLYVKTNIPQTLMWAETFNHIFGRTLNPYNRSLTSGGSSGGEGALVALKGSPIGVGSDIGGSIRIPSAFNGLYGLRPSYGRVPYAGCVNSMEGQDSVLSVLGPLCNSLNGVKKFMQSVASQRPWLKDPLAVKKPWNEEEYQLIDHGEGKRLCFAILWHDEVILPHPPVVRALEQTKQALLKAGHEVVDWKPLKHMEIYKTLGAIWAAGAAEDYRVTTAPTGEPVIATMELAVDNPNLIVTDTPTFRPLAEGISAYDLWQVQRTRRDLRQEYLDHWNGSVALTGTGRPVDAIISPCAPYVAPPHGKNKTASYTMIWNALDYTALVLPSGLFADPVLDVKKPAHAFFNDLDKANYDLYDPATFKGAPISIQLIGRTLDEEAVIAMGEIVDSALKATAVQSKL
ncbi:amidase signature domain-containing protein [Gymnopilus junonius]|uniref:amidase n=1 Tax=Gymnopilus junonius TaxID=109634 RepID=A0A9P5TQ58_GYMJU|nr:amidase signature domain-containing protein [Gymnopilus junonius]